MRIYLISTTLYKSKDWSDITRSSLWLCADCNLIDYLRVLGGRSLIDQVRSGLGNMQSMGLMDQIYPRHLDLSKLISQCILRQNIISALRLMFLALLLVKFSVKYFWIKAFPITCLTKLQILLSLARLLNGTLLLFSQKRWFLQRSDTKFIIRSFWLLLMS